MHNDLSEHLGERASNIISNAQINREISEAVMSIMTEYSMRKIDGVDGRYATITSDFIKNIAENWDGIYKDFKVKKKMYPLNMLTGYLLKLSIEEDLEFKEDETVTRRNGKTKISYFIDEIAKNLNERGKNADKNEILSMLVLFLDFGIMTTLNNVPENKSYMTVELRAGEEVDQITPEMFAVANNYYFDIITSFALAI